MRSGPAPAWARIFPVSFSQSKLVESVTACVQRAGLAGGRARAEDEEEKEKEEGG